MSLIDPINLGMVNAYLLNGEKKILVDTGARGHHTKILKTLKQRGINPEDIQLIIITHGHTDHYGAVDQLAKVTGAKVLIHKLENRAMMEGHNGNLVSTGLFGRFMKLFLAGAHSHSSGNDGERKLKYKSADILIDKDMDLKAYGFEGKIVLTPGHTEGSISILTKDNEALIGDTLMPLFPGGKPGKPIFAYSLSEIRKSIQKLIELGSEKFYPSHGKLAFLEQIREIIRRL